MNNAKQIKVGVVGAEKRGSEAAEAEKAELEAQKKRQLS